VEAPPLCERAAVLIKKFALGHLKHLIVWGKVIAEQSVELRCRPSCYVRIWERWLKIKTEVPGVIFEVFARLARECPSCRNPTRDVLYMSLSNPR
jgi:hypothetical protein